MKFFGLYEYQPGWVLVLVDGSNDNILILLHHINLKWLQVQIEYIWFLNIIMIQLMLIKLCLNQQLQMWQLLLGSMVVGQCMGMFDKYADIEVWPWQRYLLEGIDPDISANKSYVCVVCSQKNTVGDWDIICAFSYDDGDSWNYSFVANEQNVDEMYPAVYATENDVYCCYVKSGILSCCI